jgi:hypothetical protein
MAATASFAKTHSVEVVEKDPEQHDGSSQQSAYDADDIHVAALADNPEKAERPSLTAVLSIVVSRSRSKHPVQLTLHIVHGHVDSGSFKLWLYHRHLHSVRHWH